MHKVAYVRTGASVHIKANMSLLSCCHPSLTLWTMNNVEDTKLSRNHIPYRRVFLSACFAHAMKSFCITEITAKYQDFIQRYNTSSFVVQF